jgi:hypothetical protein
MAARHVTAGEHHSHEDRPDGGRRQRSGAQLVGRHSNCEHEDEHADELNGELPLELEAHASLFLGHWISSNAPSTVPPTAQSDDTLLVP